MLWNSNRPTCCALPTFQYLTFKETKHFRKVTEYKLSLVIKYYFLVWSKEFYVNLDTRQGIYAGHETHKIPGNVTSPSLSRTISSQYSKAGIRAVHSLHLSAFIRCQY
jgi:hypothetical protein